ncbi:FGGY-family carbohydrate kinase [Neobacillus sp. Marseille-QA0830]
MLYLGIDLGTTNCKISLFDEIGDLVDYAHFPTPSNFPHKGWAEYDPDHLWELLTKSIRELLKIENRGLEVATVGFSSQGESGLLVDQANKPLTPIIAWYDTRTLKLVDQWRELIPTEELYEITGLEVQHIYSLLKIQWLKDNESNVYQKADKWHCLSDYFARKISGVASMDYSLASRTMAFDIQKLVWSERLIKLAGVDRQLFPEVYPSGQILGKILPEISTIWGINPGTVVVTGGFDHMVGCAGLDAKQSNVIVASIGTTESVCLFQETFGDTRHNNGYTLGRHVLPNAYYKLGSMPSGGETIDWAIKVILNKDPNPETYLEFTNLVNKSSVGSNGVLFLPHIKGCVIPEVNQESKGSFWGLSINSRTEDLCRAVVEGICYEFRLVLEYAQQGNIEKVIAMGGGTKNSPWMQCKADILGIRIEAIDDKDLVPFGAAALGAKAIGREIVSGNLEIIKKKIYEPNEINHKYYNRVYQKVYKTLYKRQQGIDRMITESAELLI